MFGGPQHGPLSLATRGLALRDERLLQTCSVGKVYQCPISERVSGANKYGATGVTGPSASERVL